MQGSVKFFNTEKGFGFITPADGSQDVFFHITQCVETYEMPQEGDEVSFDIGAGRDGRPAATNVEPADGGHGGDDYQEEEQQEEETQE